LSIADHLRLGARLNPRWDRPCAEQRIARLGLDPKSKAGRLSGGQRAQLALTMAIAKRPELLVLDELTNAVAERDTTVMLSSHLVSDLEGFCDYLIVIVASRIRAAGPVDDLLAAHDTPAVHDTARDAPATLEDFVLAHMGRVPRPEVETPK
jgi:ABC-2 type transport system ATP-binding protein